MDHREMLEADAVVSRAVGKLPGESIFAAARRIMGAPHGDRMAKAARTARKAGLA
jgi:hypothetical protein